jgi:hypothetical protein
LSRWKTKTYEYWDIEESPFYKEGNAELYIKNRVKFPPNWDPVPMEFERQFIVVEVTIDNKGNLNDWKFDEFYNFKESNEQFLPELKEQISQIIKEMKGWSPGKLTGKLTGKDVNSKMWLDIDLDRER